MTPGRALYAAALVALVLVLGWRVVVVEQARQAALQLDDPPGTPAERLFRSPLDGDAFADRAVALREARAPAAQVVAAHEIAARRDPRDLRVRAWLAEHYLAAGRYADALAQLDVVLRLEPDTRKAVLPVLVQWADDPRLAEPLLALVRSDPVWARAFIAQLRQAVDRPGAGTMLSALRDSGDLSDEAFAHWLDALIRAGHWGEAYSHWAGSLQLPPGEPLPMLYNGDFERAPSNSGFDWRVANRPGTYTEIGATDGGTGQGARVVFLGRPAAMADLEQPLHLPPGRYRLALRARGAGLRSDQGLEWTVTCAGGRRVAGRSKRLDGSFDWRSIEMPVEVPATGCPGQWLRLVNPAPKGSAQAASGELWVDAFTLQPMSGFSKP